MFSFLRKKRTEATAPASAGQTPARGATASRTDTPWPDAGQWLQGLEWTVLKRLDGQLQGDYRSLFRGSGLVLANGSDTLAVSAGATSFTLPKAVAFGSSFNVTVQTQPIGQTCAVTAGSGTLGNLASQLGIDPAQASAQLSQMLPGLIDQLTPNGTVPEGGLGNAGDLMGMLGGLLNKS